MMLKLCEGIGRNASIAISFGLIFGLVLQPVAAQSKPILLPAVWCLLTFSMYRLDFSSFLNFVLNWPRLLFLVSWLLLFSPLLMWFIASSLPVKESTLIAMVMTAGSSPLIGAAAIGRLLRLNNAMILTLLVSSTILAPITLPFIALEFLNLEIGINSIDLIFRLSFLIGSAAIAAAVLRLFTHGKSLNFSDHALDGIIVLLLWLCGVPLMDGITHKLVNDPYNTIFLILLSFFVYIGLMLLGTLFSLVIWRNWRDAASLGLTSGSRNLAVIIVVLPASVDPEVVLYFALAQFPIYIMPAILKYFGSRFLKSD